MTPRDRLARLYFVNTLFHRLTGHDLYLAEQMLAAIDAAAEAGAGPAKLDATLRDLHEQLLGSAPDAGFAFCDGAAGDGAAGPLFVRSEVLSAVRRNAPYRQATVMVANLPGNADTQKPRSQKARRRAAERADEVAQLRDLAAKRSNPQSLVTLLIV